MNIQNIIRPSRRHAGDAMFKDTFLRMVLSISVAAIMGLAAIFIFYFHPSFKELLVQEAEYDAVQIAGNMMKNLLSDIPELKKSSLPDTLPKAVETVMADFALAKLKVFSTSGEVIYSTEPKDVGSVNRERYFHDIVAQGDSYAKVVRKDTRSLEGQIIALDVVETYVPFMKDNRFAGAFEVYIDITHKQAGFDRLTNKSYVTLVIVTSVLLTALMVSVFKTNKNIAAHRAAEEALKESEQKFRSLVESTEDSIFLVDSDCTYIFVNSRHLSGLGLPKDHFVGRAYGEFHPEEDTKDFADKIDTVFQTGNSLQYEYKSHLDGRYFLRTLSPVTATDSRIVAVTVVSKQISELKHMQDELRVLSLVDELTGLYNRRGFLTLARHQLKLADRTKKKIFMLYADLDGLKVVNDTRGHQEGDKMIRECAAIFRETYRESDIIARIGGDEFVVLPVGATEDSTSRIVERLQKKVDIHNSERTRSCKLSISVGITSYDPEHPLSLEELLEQADRLMYEQKRLKRRQQ